MDHDPTGWRPGTAAGTPSARFDARVPIAVDVRDETAISTLRVLLVDDEESNILLLRRMLREAGFENVLGVSRSADAMDAFIEYSPDLVLLDLHMPHPDGFEILKQMRAITDREDFLPIIVLTADVTISARQHALAGGASDFLTKPFEFTEMLLRVENLLRSRYMHTQLRAHDAATTAQLAERTKADVRAAEAKAAMRARVEAVIDGDGLQMVVQPIIDLATGAVAGAEALARFEGEPPRPPDRWFADAAETGLGVELEVHAIALALEHLARLPEDAFLSVNASASTLVSPYLRALLGQLGEHVERRLAVELTEQHRIDDYTELDGPLRNLRDRGIRLAVDDTGAGFASMRHILRLRPDIIKLDRALITGIDADPARRALTQALVVFAGSVGAHIVAEGIETRDELRTLRSLGVTWGQGYLLARPGSVEQLQPLLRDGVDLDALTTTSDATPEDNGSPSRDRPSRCGPAVDPAAMASIEAAVTIDDDAVLADRARLARLVHDEPVQILSAVAMQLQLLELHTEDVDTKATLARAFADLRLAAKQLSNLFE